MKEGAHGESKIMRKKRGALSHGGCPAAHYIVGLPSSAPARKGSHNAPYIIETNKLKNPSAEILAPQGGGTDPNPFTTR